MAGTDELTELADSIGERVTIPSGPVAVALSGGADSAALLWLTVRATPDVVAIHVFHGLAASALMSTAAGQIAAMCGVRLEMAVVQPAGTAEHALREARHAALLERSDGRPVLFGHTLDDQAETVVMRILRGTGIEGLGGIRPQARRLFHPLLRVRRSETRRLAELTGLPFRDDPANRDPAIVRNRIRDDLLPLAAQIMQRDVSPILARLADNVHDETEGRRPAVRFEVAGDRLRVAVGELRASDHPAVPIRRALEAWMQRYPPSRAAVGRIIDVVEGTARAAEVADGVSCRLVDGFLIFDRPGARSGAVAPVSISEGRQRWGDWSFEVVGLEGPTVVPMSTSRLLVPAESVVEVREAGDDDRVTGRRVTDALADARIPAEERARWPVITVDGEPAWIPGVRRRRWAGHLPGRYLSLSAYREPRWETFEP
ncbi:MAG: tRNA lysidine(34) synthetase TilS [Acidimicrobiia bacterium]